MDNFGWLGVTYVVVGRLNNLVHVISRYNFNFCFLSMNLILNYTLIFQNVLSQLLLWIYTAHKMFKMLVHDMHMIWHPTQQSTCNIYVMGCIQSNAINSRFSLVWIPCTCMTVHKILVWMVTKLWYDIKWNVISAVADPGGLDEPSLGNESTSHQTPHWKWKK